MRRDFVLFTIVFAVLAILVAAAPACAKEGAGACDLLTKAEAESLLRETLSDGRPGKTSMPAADTCKYTYKKKGATYGVTLKVATTTALKQENFYSSAQDVFSRQKKARMASADTAKKMQVIPGLGDDAFWNGYDLWILKGPYFVNIISSSFLPGSYPNTAAMEKARYDQDLLITRKIAEKVLPKLK
jgi:hypothetical protein